MGGSKLCFGAIESMITFETDVETGDESFEVKVRGPPGSGKNCFYFMEELLGIIDMVNNCMDFILSSTLLSPKQRQK